MKQLKEIIHIIYFESVSKRPTLKSFYEPTVKSGLALFGALGLENIPRVLIDNFVIYQEGKKTCSIEIVHNNEMTASSEVEKSFL